MGPCDLGPQNKSATAISKVKTLLQQGSPAVSLGFMYCADHKLLLDIGKGHRCDFTPSLHLAFTPGPHGP